MATTVDLRAPDLDLGPVEAALRDGALVVVPTDTVYGLACAADHVGAYARLCALKERDPGQPTAVMLTSEDALWEVLVVPRILRQVTKALVPGPVTVIVPNMGGTWRHLCGDDPDRIGVRVPKLDDPLRPGIAALAGVQMPLACTSANRHGGPEVVEVVDLDPVVLAGVDIVLDAGALPASEASTVIDISRWPVGPPEILRAGALDLSDLVGTFARLPH